LRSPNSEEEQRKLHKRVTNWGVGALVIVVSALAGTVVPDILGLGVANPIASLCGGVGVGFLLLAALVGKRIIKIEERTRRPTIMALLIVGWTFIVGWALFSEGIWDIFVPRAWLEHPRIIFVIGGFVLILVLFVRTRDPVRIISFILGVALFLSGLLCLPLYLLAVGLSQGQLSSIQILGWGILVIALPLASGVFLLVEAARAKPRLVRVLGSYLGVLTLVEAVSFIIVFDYYFERGVIGLYPLGVGNLISLVLVFLLAFLLLSPGWLYRRHPNLATYLGIACASAGGIGLIISARIILLGDAWRTEGSAGVTYYGLVVAAVALLALADAAVIFTRARRKR